MWLYRRNPAHLPIQIPKNYIEVGDSAEDRWQVGYVMPDGEFTVTRSQMTERDAARVVHYLNGGAPQEWPPHDP